MKILGVEKDVLDAEIVELISSQNDQVKSCLNQKEQFLKFAFSNDDKVGTKMVFLDASPLVWQVCVGLGKLFIGYKCCPVMNNVTVRQCLKCLRFGHKTVNCTNAPVCFKCNQNHESKYRLA